MRFVLRLRRGRGVRRGFIRLGKDIQKLSYSGMVFGSLADDKDSQRIGILDGTLAVVLPPGFGLHMLEYVLGD